MYLFQPRCKVVANLQNYSGPSLFLKMFIFPVCFSDFAFVDDLGSVSELGFDGG